VYREKYTSHKYISFHKPNTNQIKKQTNKQTKKPQDITSIPEASPQTPLSLAMVEEFHRHKAACK
jgi:hypothetical protein